MYSMVLISNIPVDELQFHGIITSNKYPAINHLFDNNAITFIKVLKFELKVRRKNKFIYNFNLDICAPPPPRVMEREKDEKPEKEI